ncbi:MAG: hypothetical protein H7Z74_10785 [Anaerolineae bacterium]|nr:hypothetical protein [Gemmatimonadaceae bacterium]
MDHLRSLATKLSRSERPLAGGGSVPVTEIRVSFKPGVPDRLPDGTLAPTYTNKPLVSLGQETLFGELAILRLLQVDGWSGVWVDTFHDRGRGKLFWTNMPHLSEPFDLRRVPRARQSYDDIVSARSGRAGGFFDVLAWRKEELIFVEYKGPKDGPNINEPHFLAAAVSCDVQPSQLFYVLADLHRELIDNQTTRDVLRTGSVGEVSPIVHDLSRAPAINLEASRKTTSMKDPLHRRKISSALQKTHRWVVKTRVDGYVEVKAPAGSVGSSDFASDVRAAVEALGYSPTVAWFTATDGSRWVRVRTPETVAQQGRGAHR